MTRSTRALISRALLLLLPLMTAGHGAHSSGVVGPAMSAHGHGPHAPCPPAPEHHCLACAAAALLAPAPAIARLTPPSRAHALSDADTPELRGETLRSEVGRSPPAC